MSKHQSGTREETSEHTSQVSSGSESELFLLKTEDYVSLAELKHKDVGADQPRPVQSGTEQNRLVHNGADQVVQSRPSGSTAELSRWTGAYPQGFFKAAAVLYHS